MTDPLLEISNLHVHFRTNTGLAQVINGVDLTIEPGQTAALVGETGCGKSVTAKAILGLLADNAVIPDGEIRYNGKNLLSLSEKERHEIRGSEMTMIMQNPMTSLNPVFTVGEQMMDVLKWQGTARLTIRRWLQDKFRNHDDLKERVIEMLSEVQISEPERVFDSYPINLSGGMRQRVLIAIALLSEPDLLIADEPGTALDVTTESKILTLFEELIEERNTAVLYVTHDLGIAREMSSLINVMYAGEIVEHGPTEEVFESPQHPYTRGLIDSIPQLSGGMGTGIEGEIPDYEDPPPACRFADRCPFAEEECSEVYPHPRAEGNGHPVACHLYNGDPVYERHTELAATERAYIGPPPWEDQAAKQ